MKTTLFLCGSALLTALTALPAFGQLILSDGVSTFTFIPNDTTNYPNYYLNSSDNTNIGLKLTMDFSFDSNVNTMTILMKNWGNPLNTTPQYRVAQYGYFAPSEWGASSLTSYVYSPDPKSGHIIANAVGQNGKDKINGVAFNPLIGEPGNGPANQAIDLWNGESVSLVFQFTLTPTDFSLAGLLDGPNLDPNDPTQVNRTHPDMGFFIQPILDGVAGSEQWLLYSDNKPEEEPPPVPVPEPATYGMAGIAALGALAAFRRLRRTSATAVKS